MYRTGLVLEGGGSRAIYTSGVLDAFMENDVEFPYVIGVSAGSCNAVSFLGKNLRRQHDIGIKYCGDKRYMSLENVFKSGEYLGCDWIFGELSYKLMPLDHEQYSKSDSVLCVVVTNAATGKAEYMYPKDMFQDSGCKILKASCSMPGVTKGVEIGKDLYYDGGVSDSIPLQKAFDDGCQKAVVVLTQDYNYIKRPVGHEKAVRKVFKRYPMMANAILSRHEMYNEQRDFVFNSQSNGNTFVIAPGNPLHCSALEKDAQSLELTYKQGYMDAMRNMESLKIFLKK